MTCQHGRTVIESVEGGGKEETCDYCGEVVETYPAPKDRPTCGAAKEDGGECERTVTNEEDTCWQHQ